MFRIRRTILNSNVMGDNCHEMTRELIKELRSAARAYNLDLDNDFEVTLQDDVSGKSDDGSDIIKGTVTFVSNNSKLDNAKFQYEYAYPVTEIGRKSLGSVAQKTVSNLLHDLRDVAAKKGY